MTQHSIGVDIGGTKISAGVVDRNGLVADTLLVEKTPAKDGPEKILHLLTRMVRDLDRHGHGSSAIGVGTAGVVRPDGVIRSSTDAIFGWAGFGLGASLAVAVGRPAFVLNDVHAAAFGEAVLGAGRGVDSFLMITVGTGVGGALCRGGIPDFGATGTAGSIGHSAARNQAPRPCPCGQVGHVEAYASGPAMERAFADATGQSLNLRQIVELADDEDGRGVGETARDVLRVGASILGTGLADAMNILDVSLVVLGGGVASIPGYRTMVREAFVAAVLPGPASAPICDAGLGTEASLVGAGLYARHSV